MKKTVAIIAVCLVSACAAPQPPAQRSTATTTIHYPDGRSAPATQAAVRPASTTSSLPSYVEQSRKFRRTGRPLSNRDAARDALTAGADFWGGTPSEDLKLGKFRLKLRRVRVDTHDFIVAEHASNIIGARRFGLTSKVANVVQGKTTCATNGDGYFVRENYRMGMVFPLNC